MFGIVQGGVYPHLRRESAAALQALDFEGYAVGGLAVGEEAEVRNQVLDDTVPHLPDNRPRYLMGVGLPSDIVEGVRRGIDMFGQSTEAGVINGAVNAVTGAVDRAVSVLRSSPSAYHSTRILPS